MVKRFSVVWMTAVVIWTSPALAQQQDPREIQARTDCLTGKVEAGVALLAELFATTGNSNFVYNQARCYEQNARPEEAINRFREYLRVAKDLSPADKADVDRHIAECHELQAEQQKKLMGATLPVASSAPAQQAVSAPAHPGTAAVAGETAPPAHGQRGPGLRITGRVILGLGLAAVGTGVVFSVLVSNTRQQMEDNSKKKVYDASLDSRGRSYDTWQWVCYGTGAGLLAVGVILRLIDYAADKRAAMSVALVPSLAPGQGGLALKGSF